ncbi:YHYH protein [Hydrogenophaga crassostreae]|uniref:YHYH protein n=1 Tax=Hydrogenophaga crassostreae TaxID=1763535 RepID=UPI001E31376A|nr:YHYH protein [Hydrogenophaga crassostreae]
MNTLMDRLGAALLGCAMAAPAMAHGEQEALKSVAEFFKRATVVAGPTAVDCTLSSGTKTRCFSITVKPEPGSYTPGPWCPMQGTDGPDRSGIWLKDGQVLDADGAFMGGLAQRYQDPNWKMVDPKTGKINVTDSREACAAAARPDVDPKYRNYCVQCLPEYLEADHQTYVIPLEPQAPGRQNDVRQSGAGVAFNGVRLDGPAPVEAILGAYTIAPFDDCGGHVNLHAGYHYHAVTDCLNKSAPAATHGAQIGMALDGHTIFAQLAADGQAPADLDRCNGHSVQGLGYHYHAGAPGGNSILACLSAEAGCALEGDAQTCDASQVRRPPPPGGGPAPR